MQAEEILSCLGYSRRASLFSNQMPNKDICVTVSNPSLADPKMFIFKSDTTILFVSTKMVVMVGILGMEVPP